MSVWLKSKVAERDTRIEGLKMQLRTQRKKILEGEAQYLCENGRTKLFHSGFTPHKGKGTLAFALSHTTDVGIGYAVIVLACLINLSPLLSPPLSLLDCFSRPTGIAEGKIGCVTGELDEWRACDGIGGGNRGGVTGELDKW